MLNKMREHSKVDRQHSYERVYQNEERDRRDELESQQPVLPNSSNSAAIRNQTRRRRNSNEPGKMDNERRKRNIIMFGLEQQPNENKWKTCERVIDLLAAKLQINTGTQHIDNLFWLGKQKQNRPLLIKFTSFFVKSEIMHKKCRLKGTKLRIENDYHPSTIELGRNY